MKKNEENTLQVCPHVSSSWFHQSVIVSIVFLHIYSQPTISSYIIRYMSVYL